jgi:hypothetical protein
MRSPTIPITCRGQAFAPQYLNSAQKFCMQMLDPFRLSLRYDVCAIALQFDNRSDMRK